MMANKARQPRINWLKDHSEEFFRGSWMGFSQIRPTFLIIGFTSCPTFNPYCVNLKRKRSCSEHSSEIRFARGWASLYPNMTTSLNNGHIDKCLSLNCTSNKETRPILIVFEMPAPLSCPTRETLQVVRFVLCRVNCHHFCAALCCSPIEWIMVLSSKPEIDYWKQELCGACPIGLCTTSSSSITPPKQSICYWKNSNERLSEMHNRPKVKCPTARTSRNATDH